MSLFVTVSINRLIKLAFGSTRNDDIITLSTINFKLLQKILCIIVKKTHLDEFNISVPVNDIKGIDNSRPQLLDKNVDDECSDRDAKISNKQDDCDDDELINDFFAITKKTDDNFSLNDQNLLLLQNHLMNDENVKTNNCGAPTCATGDNNELMANKNIKTQLKNLFEKIENIESYCNSSNTKINLLCDRYLDICEKIKILENMLVSNCNLRIIVNSKNENQKKSATAKPSSSLSRSSSPSSSELPHVENNTNLKNENYVYYQIDVQQDIHKLKSQIKKLQENFNFLSLHTSIRNPFLNDNNENTQECNSKNDKKFEKHNELLTTITALNNSKNKIKVTQHDYKNLNENLMDVQVTSQKLQNKCDKNLIDTGKLTTVHDDLNIIKEKLNDVNEKLICENIEKEIIFDKLNLIDELNLSKLKNDIETLLAFSNYQIIKNVNNVRIENNINNYNENVNNNDNDNGKFLVLNKYLKKIDEKILKIEKKLNNLKELNSEENIKKCKDHIKSNNNSNVTDNSNKNFKRLNNNSNSNDSATTVNLYELDDRIKSISKDMLFKVLNRFKILDNIKTLFDNYDKLLKDKIDIDEFNNALKQKIDLYLIEEKLSKNDFVEIQNDNEKLINSNTEKLYDVETIIKNLLNENATKLNKNEYDTYKMETNKEIKQINQKLMQLIEKCHYDFTDNNEINQNKNKLELIKTKKNLNYALDGNNDIMKTENYCKLSKKLMNKTNEYFMQGASSSNGNNHKQSHERFCGGNHTIVAPDERIRVLQSQTKYNNN